MTKAPLPSSVPVRVLQELQALGDAALLVLGNPHETLTHDERGPYLEKWRLSKAEDGSATLIHHFLRSDGDDEWHNHPWDNRTLMIAGGYWDVTPEERRWIAPGDIVVRKAAEFHRVELEPNVFPLTLFWHGPKINEWGFLGTDGIFIPAVVYLANSASRRIVRDESK